MFKKTIKLAAALLLVSALMFSLCACGGEEENVLPYSGGELDDSGVGQLLDPAGLDPDGDTYPQGDPYKGVSWPKSGALAKLPEPSIDGGYIIDEDAEKITASILGGSAEEFSDYVSKVKALGYNLNQDYDNTDDVMFYEANDAAGYSVYVQFAYGVFSVGITKITE